MNKPPEFFRKGFHFECNLLCEKHKEVTPHLVKVVSHKNNVVNVWQTCKECLTAYNKLKDLGVERPNPRVANAIRTVEYVFLITHPVSI